MVTTTIASNGKSRVETLTVPQQIARMDSGRLRAYRENLEFYQGCQWIEPQRRRERRLTLNYARAVIEKTASYTMNGVSFAVDPVAASPDAQDRARRAEQVLREMYDANATLDGIPCHLVGRIAQHGAIDLVVEVQLIQLVRLVHLSQHLLRAARPVLSIG